MMNFKKMVAWIFASTACIIAVALPAVADTNQPNLISYSNLVGEDGVLSLYEETTGGIVKTDLLSATGVQKTDIYGVKYHFNFKQEIISGEESIIGCIGLNSSTYGWTSIIWSNESSYDCKIADDGTLTYVSEEPLFHDDDIYCQIWLQIWCDKEENIELKSVEVLDKSGNQIKGLSEDDVSSWAICQTSKLSDGTLKITGFKGEPVDFEIPETINGKKVTVIDDFAFKGCTTLKSIKIPDSVVSVGDLAFYQCPALENITWSKKVRNVGNLAFYGCISLKDTTLPSSVISIGNQVFYGCNLMESITIPKSVTEIGDNAFGKCAKVNIKCYTNSTAEKYAKDNKIKYTLLDVKKPSDIKNFRCTTKADTSLSLAWNKNSTADGYIIERYDGAKWVRLKKITSNSTTSLKVNSLKASTVYKYRIRAYKMNGSKALYSAYSATVAARTNPSVMTGAKLGGRAADALRINWTKNASADGYIVEMYQNGKWVRVGKITNNSTTTFRKAGLKASTVYKFRVRAYKMSGSTALYGNFSATVTARTNPSIVKGVKIAGKAKDALRVNWTKNSSAQGYIVEMYKGGKWVRVAKITNNSTTTFRKAGLAKNTTYKFRVRAYHMSGKTALYGNYGSVSGKTAAK